MSFCKWIDTFKEKSGVKAPRGTLVVIIGHGIGTDQGAWAAAPLAMYEHPYNTLVANDMASYAKSIGLSCTILNKHGSSTAAIGATATEIVKSYGGRGCVIELHFNSYNGKATGTEVLYDLEEKDNALFAKLCLDHMVKLFGKSNRGIKHDTGRGGSNLASVKATSCLVEPLFGDNPIEAKLLKEKRTEYAKCLVDAAAEYLRNV